MSNNKNAVYQTESSIELAEIAADLEVFEISQAGEKSLEILAQMLSFLYEEDKKQSQP